MRTKKNSKVSQHAACKRAVSKIYYTAQLTCTIQLAITITLTIAIDYNFVTNFNFNYNGTQTTVTALCAAVPRALLRTAATISAQRGPVPEQMG